jgi:hypothetical protein
MHALSLQTSVKCLDVKSSRRGSSCAYILCVRGVTWFLDDAMLHLDSACILLGTCTESETKHGGVQSAANWAHPRVATSVVQHCRMPASGNSHCRRLPCRTADARERAVLCQCSRRARHSGTESEGSSASLSVYIFWLSKQAPFGMLLVAAHDNCQPDISHTPMIFSNVCDGSHCRADIRHRQTLLGL